MHDLHDTKNNYISHAVYSLFYDDKLSGMFDLDEELPRHLRWNLLTIL